MASYIYERQVDGGAWQQVAQVNSLTQTDTVGEDWGTVAYRACAVDDLGLAGPYITGETYTVNSGWVTIGGPAEDMGSQPRRFDFAFSVSVSGVASVDAITVSVARDGTQVYSGTPQRWGQDQCSHRRPPAGGRGTRHRGAGQQGRLPAGLQALQLYGAGGDHPGRRIWCDFPGQ